MSATNMKLYRSCQRAWKYKYIDRVPDDPKKAAIFEKGRALHKGLEDRLKKGQCSGDVDRTYIEKAFTAFVKANQDMYQSGARPYYELEFKYDEPFSGYTMRGICDVLWIPNNDQRRVVICDHKFVKALKHKDYQPVLTPWALRQDIQAMAYSAMVVELYKAFEVELRWCYYRKDIFEFQMVTAVVQADEVKKWWHDLAVPDIQGILACYNGEAEPAKNLQACHDYGGCQHWNTCLNIYEQIHSGLLYELRIRQQLRGKEPANDNG